MASVDSGPPGSPATRGWQHRRQLLLVAVAIVAALGLLYVLLPAAAGLGDTWARLSGGDLWWLLVAAAFELLSFASYMAYFHSDFSRVSDRIDWRASYRITMAGVMATRLLAVAGAGGIALTAWALRAQGLPRRVVAASMTTFYVLLYGVFMGSLVLFGTGLASGLLPGRAPWGLTAIPAAAATAVIAAVLLIAAFSRDLTAVGDRITLTPGDPILARLRRLVLAAPASLSSGVRGGLALVRSRDAGLLGALGWFGFDIAVLWACLNAFGSSPELGVLVMAYFVGMTANTLPVPGGIGTVDGGMIGALIGFGVEPGLAIVGVLAYRFFAFWLPIAPGAVAYAQLIRSTSGERQDRKGATTAKARATA